LTITETETFATRYPEVAEGPRYSCSLGGALATTLGIFGAVPILHSGAGCGIGQQFGLGYGAGENAGGNLGTTSTPCSCLVEEHVIFGGEDKLRKLIRSTIELVNGDFYAVISGCVPSLIGDDVSSVVRGFRDKVPIIYVETPGFKGNSYNGYDLFFEAVADQLLEPQPIQKGLVNIFGVVPNQHVFWKGDLAVIKQTLAKIGLEANIIFTEFEGLENLKKISAAELNLVFSPWNGQAIVAKLEEKFGTPHLDFPAIPVGPKETTKVIRSIALALGLDYSQVEQVIAREEKHAYRFTEYLGDILLFGVPHAFYALVGDSASVVGQAKYLSNEVGYLAEIVVVTDNPPEETRQIIEKELSEGLESAIKPEIFYEVDSHHIRQKLKDRSFLVLLSSSLEKYLVGVEFGVIHLSTTFPIFDRLILDRSYAGYRGGLALMEDLISKSAGPL
jgi:nitrogenase molybdenum-iron protein beta chain